MAESQVDVSDLLGPKASGNGPKIVKTIAEAIELVSSVENETHVLENNVNPKAEKAEYCPQCAYALQDTIPIDESNRMNHTMDFVPPAKKQKSKEEEK